MLLMSGIMFSQYATSKDNTVPCCSVTISRSGNTFWGKYVTADKHKKYKHNTWQQSKTQDAELSALLTMELPKQI